MRAFAGLISADQKCKGMTHYHVLSQALGLAVTPVKAKRAHEEAVFGTAQKRMKTSMSIANLSRSAGKEEMEDDDEVGNMDVGEKDLEQYIVEAGFLEKQLLATKDSEEQKKIRKKANMLKIKFDEVALWYEERLYKILEQIEDYESDDEAGEYEEDEAEEDDEVDDNNEEEESA